jgi:hypothetical protein
MGIISTGAAHLGRGGEEAAERGRAGDGVGTPLSREVDMARSREI